MKIRTKMKKDVGKVGKNKTITKIMKITRRPKYEIKEHKVE